MTFPKRTVDLEVGDVIAMYGTRERVAAIESRSPHAVMARMMDVTSGRAHDVCFHYPHVPVELPKGMRLVAVPIEDPS